MTDTDSECEEITEEDLDELEARIFEIESELEDTEETEEDSEDSHDEDSDETDPSD